MSDFPDAKGAMTYLKAGLGVRKLPYSHSAIGLFCLFLFIGGIYRYFGSIQAIASLGLTVMVIVSVKIFHWSDAVGEKTGKFTDRAIDWKPGSLAEESVVGLLEALPDTYFAVADFVTKKGSIDCILVGPKGILTFETKSHKGVVTNHGEKLLRDGDPFGEDFIGQAWAKSYCVRDLLSGKGVCSLTPQPVIVFTDADVPVKGRVRRVHIIGSKDLRAFLESLPAWLSERLSTRIIDCLLSSQSDHRDRMPKPKAVVDTIESVPTEKLLVSPTIKH